MTEDKKHTPISENSFNRETAIVTKRNELIAGHALMSINETRIFHAALAMIDSRDNNVTAIKITRSQLAYALQTTTSNVGKMINPKDGSPGILEELQTRYVKAPAIYDTRAISINGLRAEVEKGGDGSVFVVKGSNSPTRLKDKLDRPVYFKEDQGLIVYQDNMVSPALLDKLVDAVGEEINHKGQNDQSEDDRVYLYVDPQLTICGFALAKNRQSSQSMNISIFDTSAYIEEEGVIVLEFGHQFKPYVLGLKENFTSSYFKYLINLTNSISTDLYETLRQELPINSVKRGKLSHTFTISIDRLREKLGITDKYLRPADFKRAILDRSKEQINGRTDLSFDYEFPERRNSIKAKITKVTFTVTATNIKKAKVVLPEDLEKEMEKYFGAQQSKTIMAKFDTNQCLRNLNLYYRAKETTKIISPTAWIRDAIRYDYVQTKGVLSPSEYPNPIEKQFVSDVIRVEWEFWDEDDKEDFISNRLKAPFADIRFREFLKEHDLEEKYAKTRPRKDNAKAEIDLRLHSEIYK